MNARQTYRQSNKHTAQMHLRVAAGLEETAEGRNTKLHRKIEAGSHVCRKRCPWKRLPPPCKGLQEVEDAARPTAVLGLRDLLGDISVQTAGTATACTETLAALMYSTSLCPVMDVVNELKVFGGATCKYGTQPNLHGQFKGKMLAVHGQR